MSDQLPKHVDAHRLARQESRLVGTIPVSRLARLGAFLSDHRGTAEAELQFGMDPGGIEFVRGRVQAELALVCQRCLEPLTEWVRAEFCLGLAASEALAARLSEVYEPVLVGDEPLGTWELIEDELILALPIVPRHEPQQCAAQVPREPKAEPGEERPNPFAALEQLKHKGRSD